MWQGVVDSRFHGNDGRREWWKAGMTEGGNGGGRERQKWGVTEGGEWRKNEETLGQSPLPLTRLAVAVKLV